MIFSPPKPLKQLKLCTTSTGKLSAAIALTACLAGEAAAYDIRECRMESLTFVNPWSQGAFKVKRVGVDLYYACGAEETLLTAPEDKSACLGPFGKVILDGSFTEHDESERFLAVYELNKGNSPCCGWSVFPQDEGREAVAEPVWLKPGASPKLAEWPFAVIQNEWGTRDDLNGAAALICDPDLS